MWGWEDAHANPPRPHVVILSANDAVALEANFAALCDHMNDPRIDPPHASTMMSLPVTKRRVSKYAARAAIYAFPPGSQNPIASGRLDALAS